MGSHFIINIPYMLTDISLRCFLKNSGYTATVQSENAISVHMSCATPEVMSLVLISLKYKLADLPVLWPGPQAMVKVTF